MDCVICKAQNPEGAKYCTNCGIRLDLSSGPLKDILEASVRQEVDRALQRYVKEERIAEFDITEKVTTRLLGWAKILGTLIGVLLVVAGLLGVKSLTDLYEKAKKELQVSVESAKKELEKQKTELSTLTSDYTNLHDRYTQLNSKLPEYEQISQSATELKTRLDRITNSLAQQDKRIGELDSQVQKLIGHVGKVDILEIDSALVYESGMMIDNDGAYHGFDPKDGMAGSPGNWTVPTDNGLPNGKPIIQSAKDPAPGFYVSSTSLQDPNRDRTDPRRYVNAEAVNYIVLPPEVNLGAKLGDFAVIIRPETGAHACAVYADFGPKSKIGEGSIALADALGISSNFYSGGVVNGIVYIVFPGSTLGWPLSQQEIDQKATALFSNWGGMEKAKKCFPNLTWR
jgi:uncharacterized membrane-anchored protein YhcB (DUF1043 family)